MKKIFARLFLVLVFLSLGLNSVLADIDTVNTEGIVMTAISYQRTAAGNQVYSPITIDISLSNVENIRSTTCSPAVWWIGVRGDYAGGGGYTITGQEYPTSTLSTSEQFDLPVGEVWYIALLSGPQKSSPCNEVVLEEGIAEPVFYVLAALGFISPIPPSVLPPSALSSEAQKVDSNNDDKIDILDFHILILNWGSTTPGNVADFNDDGIVDIFDFNLLMIHWTI